MSTHFDTFQPVIDDQPAGTIAPLPTSELVTTQLHERKVAALDWLWPGRVPIGKLTMLVGDPGLGKSLVALDIAARVSRGMAPPQFAGAPPSAPAFPGSVVLMSAEDGLQDTIIPRLMAAGADLDRIALVEPERRRPAAAGGANAHVQFSLSDDLPALEKAIDSLDQCRLVVLDPITAYLGTCDGNHNLAVRRLLAPLAELSARTGVAVLAINHLNKMGQGPAIYRSLGSLAFTATARSVLAVFADPHDAAARTLVSLKSNVAAAIDGIGFRIAPAEGDAAATALSEDAAFLTSMPIVQWGTTPIRMTAEEILRAAQNAGSGPAVDEAAEWLTAVLAAGPHTAADLKAKAKQDGIHERTLLRAKARLRVVTSREGFGLGGNWVWALPKA